MSLQCKLADIGPVKLVHFTYQGKGKKMVIDNPSILIYRNTPENVCAQVQLKNGQCCRIMHCHFRDIMCALVTASVV
jgi:hypothetical protein